MGGRFSNTEEFIEKAKKAHLDKYDYSKVNYINTYTHVIITCPIHGNFLQAPFNHLLGRGCPDCGLETMRTKIRTQFSSNTDEFIQKSIKVHRDKYNYDKVKYVNWKTPVIINCPIHGDFQQIPQGHLQGRGCAQCGKEKPKYSTSQDDFIKRSHEIHNTFYNYDKVEYTHSFTSITITCPIHGDFQQTPAAHLQGRGCPQCGMDSIKDKLSFDAPTFIEKAKKVYGDKYDYSEVVYVNNYTPVIIACKEHGKFQCTPNGHLRNNSRCPQCKDKENLLRRFNNFIQKSNKVHNNRYEYTKVQYTTTNEKVIITCPIHGDFQQTPQGHLHGRGCSKCSMSRGELIIEKALQYLNIEYKMEYKLPSGNPPHGDRVVVDFFIPELGCIIEFHGIQHFKYVNFLHGDTYNYIKQLERDNYLRYYIAQYGLKYLEFNYKELTQCGESLFEKIVCNRIKTIKHHRSFNTHFNNLYTLCKPQMELYDIEDDDAN